MCFVGVTVRWYDGVEPYAGLFHFLGARLEFVRLRLLWYVVGDW